MQRSRDTRRSQRTPLLLFLTLVMAAPCSLFAGAPWDAAPMDWPYWRGPEMNGISREKNLPESWDPDGENVLWKRDDLGSRSTPITMNGRLYLILRAETGTINEGERVVCLDQKTGETIWEKRFNVFLSDVPDTRVGWSAVTGDPETGNVFALGVCGLFMCLDGKTGEEVWTHSLSEEYGLLSTYGGRTNFPIVHENLVIISAVIIGWGEMAKPAHRFIAFDKRNGQAVWFEGTRLLPYDTTYSAPTLANINGQAQLIFGSGDGGVHGFAPRTGQKLWSYEVSHRGINTSPLVVDNVVYGGHSEENHDSTLMGALFAIDPTKSGSLNDGGELWRIKKWFVGKSSPLMVDGRLYAIEDKAQMLVVDPKTGEQIARQKMGTMQRSSPLYADGKIYVATANGRWYTMKPTEDGVEIVHKMRLDGECHGSCIVSHGRLYVPTTNALYCIGNKDAKPESDERPEVATETPVEDDLKPAHLQLVPCESLLTPGQKQQFQVRMYNKAGQFLGLKAADEVKFTIDAEGSIGKDGKYLTPETNKHFAVNVVAEVDGIKGDARIRVVPGLPWSFGFDDGEVPVTWVGARYRAVALDWDVLTKLNDADPLAGQMYIYLNSSFTNSGRDALKFDRSSSRQTLQTFLRFLKKDREATSVETAEELLSPSLAKLKEVGVLADFAWSTNDDGMVLTASKGTIKSPGEQVMNKITTIPKGARSQAWMGHTDLKDFTIQADVLGVEKSGRLPDIGIIGQRYTLDMMGASQQLQIRTWPPQLRMAKSVPFKWEPNTWYTVKLQSSNENGMAVLRAKAWKRGEQEPAKWMLEATDPVPNTHGSPGLFGNAKDSEIFYDNIKVYSNDS